MPKNRQDTTMAEGTARTDKKPQYILIKHYQRQKRGTREMTKKMHDACRFLQMKRAEIKNNTDNHERAMKKRKEQNVKTGPKKAKKRKKQKRGRKSEKCVKKRKGKRIFRIIPLNHLIQNIGHAKGRSSAKGIKNPGI